jgi:Putative auto-transporter adhesin, head GIN domain
MKFEPILAKSSTMRAPAFLSVLLFCIAIPGYSQQDVYGDGSNATVTRSIPSFTKLHNSVSGQVVVVRGDRYQVKIEGEGNIIQALVAEVKDGELKFGFPNSREVRKTRPYRITVTTPGELSAVSNSGAGGIRVDGIFKSPSMQVENSGSAAVEIELGADQLDLRNGGRGSILIKGRVKQLQCINSGSGNIQGNGLSVDEHSEIQVSGKGSCTIMTNGSIEGDISGSGAINYVGNPTSVKVDHSGTGRPHRIE